MTLPQHTCSVPQGQPAARIGWVERALARHGGPRDLGAVLSRIPAQRRVYYGDLSALVQRARARGRRVVLDTGCGTGESTRRRASAGEFYLGVDKSLDRIQRGSELECGALGPVPVWRALVRPSAASMARALDAGAAIARAELTELVAVLRADDCLVDRVDFMYPNPWPKSQHFGRRWYGHPVWHDLLVLGHEVELRTNWEVYAQEFSHALRRCVPQTTALVQSWSIEPERALTAFERKYAQAGHALFRVRGRGALSRS